jgi:FixJ family two-component response regulator
MIRANVVAFRASDEERQAIRAVAEHLSRTESDMLRMVIRSVAAELGVSPQPQDGTQADRQEVSSTAT